MIMCCCSVTLFAQTNTGKKQTSTNPFLTVGMQIPKESFSVINTGFIRLIQLLSNNNLYMDAFSSPDLVHWRKHPKVLSVENISWLRNALWAPAVIEANGKYYFYFGANNIYHESEVGRYRCGCSRSSGRSFQGCARKAADWQDRETERNLLTSCFQGR